ncbi:MULTISPECIES: transaldolase [unclassified Streptomyces]|uniref:transaldolase n=1 Tax=unclassified Streptomyces TaxID=2593676 RepID=UPI000DC7E7B5|nr:transaldolase [Streptomyces sp. ICC4]AWZ14659.1 transaldolase [Streptomyces sp. ICC1]
MSGSDVPDRLAALSAAGVSVWLDDLSRELLADGELKVLIADKHVVGVTTNPTIFASALSKGDRYDQQLRRLGSAGTSVDDAVFALTTDDVRDACEVFGPVYERTGGVDGRVSIEVDPRLAQDAATTADQARKLWEAVGRPNVFVKIPATRKGLEAITDVVAQGISVNVTLIFSLDRYREVMDAYQTGLEQAHAAGREIADIHSVASFFVSRVDTEVDRRLQALDTPGARALRGKTAIANARLAFQAYEQMLLAPRWQVLAAAGARMQRPLWASTGVKDPAYPDTMYVSELVVAGTVNTMPGATLAAFADHGALPGPPPVADDFAAAAAHFEALERAGVDFADVTDTLEREGLATFEASWKELGASVAREMHCEGIRAGDASGSGDGGSDRADLLGIYLNDHYAAATGGLELFRRAAKAHAGKEDGEVLSGLARRVEEDRDSLAQIMTALAISTSQSKAAMGWLAEKAGRLKPNGHVLSRSPLSDVVEAESMLLAVHGKAAGWRSLRALAETDDRLSVKELDVLLERADQQGRLLEELRVAAATRSLHAQPSHTR